MIQYVYQRYYDTVFENTKLSLLHIAHVLLFANHSELLVWLLVWLKWTQLLMAIHSQHFSAQLSHSLKSDQRIITYPAGSLFSAYI